MITVLDIKSMSPEQLKQVKESAKKALDNYQKEEYDSNTGIEPQLSLLRYAQAGLYEVKETEK